MGHRVKYIMLGIVFFVVLSSSLVLATTESMTKIPVLAKDKFMTPLSTSTTVIWKASATIYIKGIFRKTVYFSAYSESRTKDRHPFNIDHIGLESTVKAYYDLGWHVVHRGRHDDWNDWYVSDLWSERAHYERYLATTHHWFEDARFQNWYPTLTVSVSR
ncbi:hypothetical protein [Thermococcus camini]|uniref:Uncharacterized protein n=1 Tax=Thermococcus camini TaxID=2016373 RepID=A0A7G2DDJ6_9EURY|nr:hypothetical protein [Thermococcus camini]CAD5245223.1 exported protein of unknown function [Thermococcus camini]